MNFHNIKRIYMIGIGGIGMSALARYFNERGVSVSGYDRSCSILTKELESEGIPIHYVDNLDLIDRQADLVIYTPAIKELNELKYYQIHSFPILKRSQVLGLISQHSDNICIAGTHGKSTITTSTAFLLRDTGFGCNAFLGAVSLNYHTTFWSDKNNVSVIEADEYDRSFLQLHPHIAVITSLDADHLDIYGTRENMVEAYHQFAKQIRAEGILIYHHGLQEAAQFEVKNKLTYDLYNKQADAYTENLRIENGHYHFDAVLQNQCIKDCSIRLGGRHNVENILVAMLIASLKGIDAEKIKKSIQHFKGLHRRFEYVVQSENFVLIDDYAHHPSELQTLIQGMNELYPEYKKIVMFQPHLFTRTRDFAEAFARVLSQVDNLILLPIYPARELPIDGITSNMLLDKISSPHKMLMQKNEVVPYVMGLENKTVLAMAGAGDIDLLIQQIREQNQKA